MIGAYLGMILNVDLSTGTIADEALDEKLVREFLGGAGLGARILFGRQKAGVDSLGPENALGFVTGAFTGTPVPYSGRWQVVGKSPLTQTWGDANCGGDFGPNLKFGGYGHIFFSGISERPAYLFVDDGKPERRSAEASEFPGRQEGESSPAPGSGLASRLHLYQVNHVAVSDRAGRLVSEGAFPVHKHADAGDHLPVGFEDFGPDGGKSRHQVSEALSDRQAGHLDGGLVVGECPQAVYVSPYRHAVSPGDEVGAGLVERVWIHDGSVSQRGAPHRHRRQRPARCQRALRRGSASKIGERTWP